MTTDTKVMTEIMALQPNVLRLVVLLAHFYQINMIGINFQFSEAYRLAGTRLGITKKTYANYVSMLMKSGLLVRKSKSEYSFGDGVLDYAIHVPSDPEEVKIKAFEYMPKQFFGMSEQQGLILLKLTEKASTSNKFTYNAKICDEIAKDGFEKSDIRSTMEYLISHDCIRQIGSHRYMLNPKFMYLGADKSWEFQNIMYEKQEEYTRWLE